MAAEQRTWFHGYVAWYLRAAIWFGQALVAGVILRYVLGSAGVVLSGFVGALLLFRQIDRHIEQELDR